MSNSIYEEAILDAKALKEAAEERAKQKLLEAMTPKIKLLVEKSILDEEKEFDEIEENDIFEQELEIDEIDNDESISDEDEDSVEKINNDLESESFEITNESVNVIKKLMTRNFQKSVIEEKLNSISESVKLLKKTYLLAEGRNLSKKRIIRFNKILNNLNEELKNLKDNSIINSDNSLLETYLRTNKELKTMSRRRSSKYLNESLDDLLEIDLFEEDEDEDDVLDPDEDLDVDSDKDGEDEEFDLGDDLSDDSLSGNLSLSDAEELRRIADEIESSLDQEEDMDDEDMKDMEEDMEDMEEDDEDMQEESWIREMEEEEYCESDDLDSEEGDVLEIDENMLRREIGKMKRLREGEASAMASHFGGGSLDKEMFVDVDDGLLNALANQVGDAPHPTLKKEAALRRNAQRKNRLMQKQLKEYKTELVNMKKHLNEMNLFNAKLLYANKLMQNRDLSITQQKHIVESLDNAATLNEAKLLFESLSKSLTRSRSQGGNLNESASRRILGSSSRSVGSSQSARSSSADLDRWAILAGIKK